MRRGIAKFNEARRLLGLLISICYNELMDETLKILENLLRYPAETLEVEIKPYLDLSIDKDKADVAKELIALANHGGGYLIFGFDEDKSEGKFTVSPHPQNLKHYNQDFINGIIQKYADPAFHCYVHMVKHPDSDNVHPIVSVPGAHLIPIHAKRDGPNNEHIRKLACYIRRAGGLSEIPQNSGEWQALLQRCVRNNQAELLNAIRGVVTGNVTINNQPSDDERLDSWVQSSLQTWKNKTDALAGESIAKLPKGYFLVAFLFTGYLKSIKIEDLVEYTSTSSPGVSSWPPFITLRPLELAPYLKDGLIEAFIDPTYAKPAPSLSDFWRVSPSGMGFSLRGHSEDIWSNHVKPGTIIDPRLQTRIVAEYLMFIEKYGNKLLAEQSASVTIRLKWTGLENRELQDILGVGGYFIKRVSRTNQVAYTNTIEFSSLKDNLSEVVQIFVENLFRHFSFFSASPSFYKEQIDYLKK
jgi:Putative DNA-binding domain